LQREKNIMIKEKLKNREIGIGRDLDILEKLVDLK
jgi:hypothetical protein